MSIYWIIYVPTLILFIVFSISMFLNHERLEKIKNVRSVKLNIIHLDKNDLVRLNDEDITRLRFQLRKQTALGAAIALVMGFILVDYMIAVFIVQITISLISIFSLYPLTKEMKNNLE